MKKIIEFLKGWGFAYLIITMVFALIEIGVRRRFNIPLNLNFLTMVKESLIISFFIQIAFVIFRTDKLPTFLRIVLGYMVLFYTTFIIRLHFGKFLFRSSFILLIFVFFCTIAYLLTLFLILLMNRKEATEMNKALNQYEEHEQKDEKNQM